MNRFSIVAAAAACLALVACNSAKSQRETAEKDVATSVRDVRNAIDLFAIVEHRLPSNLVELTKPGSRSGDPILQGVPKDPWGRDYDYLPIDPVQMEYGLRSGGPDMKFGNEDDILVKARAGR